MKKVVMVPVSMDVTLYLFALSKEGELSFKSSRNMKQPQKETILIKKGICYTRLYHFSEECLKGLNQ